jgi:hypothetical protein
MAGFIIGGIFAMPVGQMQKTSTKIFALFLLGMLAACGGDQAVGIPTQKWQGMEVRVEVRPSPSRAGMRVSGDDNS